MAAKKTLRAAKKVKAKKSDASQLDIVQRVTARKPAGKMDEFRAGDTVNVYVKVKEGEKERVQLYKGLVTKLQGHGVARTFTVRKISAGVGVERTFPFVSPALDKVEVVNRGNVRRSKLYFLRSLEGKAAKIASELVVPGTSDASATAEATTEKK